jgi:microcystin-dependent protein
MDEFIGIVKLFAGSYAPQGWALCDGSLLNIRQYSALYAILGLAYGGDGINTFALPDLRGRVALGAGNGPGLAARTAGEKAGAETSPVPTTPNAGTTDQPGTLAAPNYTDDGGSQRPVNAYTSGALQVPTMPPFLGMNYIICVAGLYPSRP